MHISRSMEILVGFFVAIGFVAMFFLSMEVSNLSSVNTEDGYDITASFENIGSLKVRAPVAMAGVNIGRVKSIKFDSETFEAVVTMNIETKYNQLPSDTNASILTAGLLGEQYIGLEPGGEEDVLKNGSVLELTQSAVVLEQLIGQFLFNSDSE
ncbi:MAG: outer membrane lipid asymmetry maintenance protein MlaD [Cycloclasticus sp.]|jgi:phospholipid/cholesterol/gamma-HCH transport system substrate-binding protein|nr:MAG: outer membrane lipid asymmetry maintenance protein MlaD [Cycloclasticus sp. Phe_18]MBV1912264.1 outer membrane lipid asymmetry maintenance protein MlaD [Cycloclasticus sp.]MDF1689825.1 outer membrane lipid asymmetry maintenance protein MlaD [Cycloclasticus sp.]MEE4290902.1 outer membrane lipid asymmetry maintenance protein MlaD [Cycloclasticus sp.]